MQCLKNIINTKNKNIMKTILIATDFSPAALNAANYAADMAGLINANLILFHTYQVPVSYAEVPVAVNMSDLVNEAQTRINRIKDDLLTRTANKINIDTRIKEGAFFYELKTICDVIKPYAVVMGSQGTSAVERFLFGGHAVHAMQYLDWPLITVPPDVHFSAVKKIGLACDFDKVVETTPVDEIKMLVNDFNASLHVLNTGKRTEYKPDIVFESGMLQEMIGSLKPQYHFITAGNTDEGIMEFVEKNNIDLLLVLPKRRGVLKRLLHRSTTKQFVLHSHVPVMAIH
jgi:nucleotide-binding universal stress UspA family protein